MNVRATSQAPPLDPRETEALAHALHGDPFRLLGPHDTAAGRVIRGILPHARLPKLLGRAERD
jgi:1,4-alpha-glucan branching enzyme